MAEETTESPERIEAEIGQTREELGDTVAALAEKSDVKQQAQEKVEEAKRAAQAKISATTEVARERLEAAPEMARHGKDRAVAALRENPGPALAAGGALVVAAAMLRRGRR